MHGVAATDSDHMRRAEAKARKAPKRCGRSMREQRAIARVEHGRTRPLLVGLGRCNVTKHAGTLPHPFFVL